MAIMILAASTIRQVLWVALAYLVVRILPGLWIMYRDRGKTNTWAPPKRKKDRP